MQKVKKGFTLIELSLSMVFIATLSLIMVVIIMNTVSAYRRGLTLDLINTTGLNLIEEFRTSIQASPARSLSEECTEMYTADNGALSACKNDTGGHSLVTVARYGNVILDGVEERDVPVYGALCTGKWTYVWNTGYFLNGDRFKVDINGREINKGMRIKYRTIGMGPGEYGLTSGDEKLLKIGDVDRMICKRAAGYDPKAADHKGGVYETYDNLKGTLKGGGDEGDAIDVTNIIISGEPEELLKGDEFTNLALFDLTTAVPAKVAGVNTLFYSMSFVLGTLQGGANVKQAGGNCKPPTDESTEFEYCAINKFNFAVQANGG